MEAYNCPNCIAEELIRVVGNVLVCQECELVWVETTDNDDSTIEPVYKRDLKL